MIKLNGTEIKPTIFPDGTSQVWKLDLDGVDVAIITWHYEQEVELIWINQLIALMYQSKIPVAELYIPYLPYGRQDKDISNTSTFAKHVFLEMLLKEHVVTVSTLDAHSSHDAVLSYDAHQEITHAIWSFGEPSNTKSVVLVFPDKGAKDRYADMFSNFEYIVLDKVRNQLTGKIESLVIDREQSTFDVEKQHFMSNVAQFLIIDDISDYGGTFKLATKALKNEFVCTVGLYVTHYLGHGGIQQLYDAGISKIYTTDSLTPYRTYKSIDDTGVIIV